VKKKSKSDSPSLYWKSYEKKLLWFELNVSLPDFKLIDTSDQLIAKKLIEVLKITYKLNPDFIESNQNYLATSRLSFKRNWGLGSSSTLIANIANWANVNPYELLKNTFGGSGYDIACADTEHPIIFNLEDDSPQVEEINFDPVFKGNLFFIYSGKKQSSAESIQYFESLNKSSKNYVNAISEISNRMAKAENLTNFQNSMRQHEEIIAKILNKKRIKEEFFPDFKGEIKSLGAWGGDFIMAASEDNSTQVEQYFKSKGLNVIFKFEDLVK
jgi:mevalonate kinase